MIALIVLADGDEYEIDEVGDWVMGEEILALYADALPKSGPKPDPFALITLANIASVQFLEDEIEVELEEQDGE